MATKRDQYDSLVLSLVQETRDDVKVLRKEVTSLKQRASFWGAVSGFATAGTAWLISIFHK